MAATRAGSPTLRGTRVILRMGRVGDIPEILEYFRRNRAHLGPWIPKRPRNAGTPGYWKRQLRTHAREFRRDLSLRMFVFKIGDPRRVMGQVNLFNFVRGAFQACTLGYAIDAREERRGFMTESLRMAIRYVFETMRFHRVMANYMPRNRRSARLLRRLGFRVEGRAREYLSIAGRWEDHILTSLVNRRLRTAD